MKKNICLALSIASFFCTSLRSDAQVVFQETFDGDSLPAGWYQDSSGYAPVVNGWNFNETTVINGAGFDTCYARIYLTPINWDNPPSYRLISPSFDASGLSSVYLSYGDWGGCYLGDKDEGLVDISNNGGSTWNTVFRYNGYHGQLWNAFRNIIDITSVAAGYSNVKIRFYVKVNDFYAGLSIDSIVVNSSTPCNNPVDTMGKAANNRSYCCTGTEVHLRNDNLSGGVGQTYQWQYSNAATGNIYTNIAGAVYDTTTFLQNGNTYYQCIVTCNGSTTNTLPVYVTDTPNQSAAVWSTNVMGICGLVHDTVYIVSEKNVPGLTYQWQDAPAPVGPFNDIAGATDTFYVVTPANYTADTWFKCKQVCASNGNFNISSYTPVYLNANPYCYCTPYNLNPCPPPVTGFGGNITNVAIQGTSLANSNNVCQNIMGQYNNYLYFAPAAGTTAYLNKNTTYTISVTNDTIDPNIFVMWLDYDRSGTFDSSEYSFIQQLGIGGSGSGNFTVPANAQSGLTGLRVRAFVPGDPYNSNSACWGFYGGQTQDYMVTIDTTVSISSFQPPASSLSLYPNPATKELTVSSGSMQQGGSIYIQNMLGETVYTHHAPLTTYQTTFNIAALPPGIYFVKLQTANCAAVRKFVKQ